MEAGVKRRRFLDGLGQPRLDLFDALHRGVHGRSRDAADDLADQKADSHTPARGLLERCEKEHAAVLLNVTPDHMDRYPDFAAEIVEADSWLSRVSVPGSKKLPAPVIVP